MNSKVRQSRRGFTLVEVLVVISIFVLLLAVAVPAFSSMLYSSEQSLAGESLRIALNTARDVAARSPSGQDAAAVFLYDRDTKKTTVLICTRAGTIMDETSLNVPGAPTDPPIISREVFAAAPGIEPVQMTAGWAVRGYAPANTIDDEWYGDPGVGTYAATNFRRQGNWLFPETSFFNDVGSVARAEGPKRQTFMVRFEGGTGLVKASDFAGVLVLSPSPGTAFRNGWPTFPNLPPAFPPYDPQLNHPLNPLHEADALRFCRRVIAWPTTGAGSIPPATKRSILGSMSSDMVLTKAVGQLALYNEGRLARALGIRPDAATGCLYADPMPPPPATQSMMPQLMPGVITSRVNEWIEGRLYQDSPANTIEIDSDCRIFTLQRYLGWLQEVTGTEFGEGMGS